MPRSASSSAPISFAASFESTFSTSSISEDGALHAEKYFQTVSEEYGRGREKFRWLHVVALARVTASQAGQPAPGVAEARKLLGV